MNSKVKILVIEDEPYIREDLKLAFGFYNFYVFEAENCNKGFVQVKENNPDLIILDLGLPDLDGIDFIKKLRKWNKTPILVLSARNSKQEIISALNFGADDYLVKPYDIGELMARVKNVLRHSQKDFDSSIFQFGSLVVDLNTRIVKKKGKIANLSPTQYIILESLVRNAGKVTTYSNLMEKIYGDEKDGNYDSLRVLVANIRKEIGDFPGKLKAIDTVHGVGYRFNKPD